VSHRQEIDYQFPVSSYETNPSKAESTYPTGFGEFTFEGLYKTTSRIVGHVLRDQMGMSDPEDIDDCMQSGYLKVWEHLQYDPNVFAEKPKKYVIQAVVFHSKAQRYTHLRHHRKIAYEVDLQENEDTVGLTISRIDIWIDLAWALQRVAEYTVAHANSMYLLALYALITTAKTQDVASTSRYAVSTLTAAKRKVRVTLARELSEYGILDNTIKPLPLPKKQSTELFQNRQQLISVILVEDMSSRLA
jgi:hypothetical protein